MTSKCGKNKDAVVIQLAIWPLTGQGVKNTK